MAVTGSKVVQLPKSALTLSDNIVDAVNNLPDIEKPRTSVYHAQSGVVFRLRRVPSLVVSEAAKTLIEPRIPTYFDEDSNRERDNPNDPQYLSDVNKYQYEQGMLAFSVYFTLGTQVLTVPELDEFDEPFPKWNDEGWETEIEEAARGFLIVPKKGKARYLAWIEYKALDETEMNELMTQIMRLSGETLEADVQTAQDKFPGETEGSETQ